jgi:DNA-binding PadR family transcriptional regulator
MEITKDLVAASSRIMILSILSAGESYGYQILQSIKFLSENEWEWSDGMIYPILHRLENEKLITSRWEKIGENRKRKYYTITLKGIQFLEKAVKEWAFVHGTLQKAVALHHGTN